MRITRLQNRLVATHVSGPIHVFLEFEILHGSETGLCFQVDGPQAEWPVDAVREAVLQGINDAGGTGPTDVQTIRVLSGDTPSLPVYRRLAEGLAIHLKQHPFEVAAEVTA